MTQHRITKINCPGCNRILDGTTGLDTNGLPKKGDITLCMYCGILLVFDADLSRRVPTDDELVDIESNPYTVLKINIAREFIKKNNANRPN